MKDRYLINSILRACNILKSFSREKETFKISELAQQLHLDRSTTYRILLSPEKSGLVEKDEKNGTYSLGVGAFEVGSAYLRRADFVQISRPIMSDLALKVQETVHLAILSGTEILYLDKIDSPRTLGVISKIGQRAPVYCTGLGKVMLAYLPEDERSKIIDGIRFMPYTKNTITSKKRFIEELQVVRRRGYAQDRREHEEDVECVAAPIRNDLGHVIAALSISGPTIRLSKKIVQEIFRKKVVETALKISHKMGFREGGGGTAESWPA